MINDFFKPYRIFGNAAVLTALFFCGLAQAQNNIPDSIQLNDEIPAYSRFSSPSAQITQVQYQEAVSAPVPNGQPQAASPMSYPNAPVQGTPAYTPDGAAPVMGTAPIMDGAVMETSCDGLFLGDFCEPVCQPSCGGILGPGCLFVEGWVDQGFNVNSNKKTSSNLPMATDDYEGYQLNQLYLSFGRRVIKADQWSLGGQIDLMYGTDYYYMTSTGLETTTENLPHINGQEYDQAEYRANYSKYGMAIPQFFAEIYVPLLNGVDVKLGHFNSIMGFESNQATQNFFYSRSYQSVYGLPTSMTGVITDWKIGQCFSIIAGGVNEWNAFCTSGDENFSFIVGATYENLCGNFAVSALVMNGKQRGATFMPYGYPEDAYDTTLFNLILKYKFTDRLAYVGEFTYGNNDAPVVTWDGDEFQGRNWYGFSNYLFYVVNEHVTFGARFEWFQDKENTVMTGGNRVTVQNTPANYFAWSFGVNWEPFTWLNIRPEVRWDYSDLEIEGVPNGYAFDNGTSKTQFTFGLDAIVKF
ncbi:MAG: outer membrane beta-barrel protein [Thermoguttaceae bacterium]|nr:outer membrane beta-barrel protein [Thermoguttaceae bacterium]